MIEFLLVGRLVNVFLKCLVVVNVFLILLVNSFRYCLIMFELMLKINIFLCLVSVIVIGNGVGKIICNECKFLVLILLIFRLGVRLVSFFRIVERFLKFLLIVLILGW